MGKSRWGSIHSSAALVMVPNPAGPRAPPWIGSSISTSWNMGRSSNIHMQSLKFQPQDNTVKFWGQKISGWLPCFCYQNVWFFWCWFNHGSFPLNLECDQSTAYFTHSTLSYEGKGANRRPQQLPSAAKIWHSISHQETMEMKQKYPKLGTEQGWTWAPSHA